MPSWPVPQWSCILGGQAILVSRSTSMPNIQNRQQVLSALLGVYSTISFLSSFPYFFNGIDIEQYLFRFPSPITLWYDTTNALTFFFLNAYSFPTSIQSLHRHIEKHIAFSSFWRILQVVQVLSWFRPAND